VKKKEYRGKGINIWAKVGYLIMEVAKRKR